MRKVLYILLAFWIVCSCQDDEVSFEVPISQDNLTFKPIPGGAVMHYKLPQDPNILSIQVRYQDAFGKEITRLGSYVGDSIVLFGFNEARKDIPAQVSLRDHNDVESKPINVTFNTGNSGAITFFDKLEVKSTWAGFMLSYDVPENANGMAHVFYIGADPLTQDLDTLLVESFQIKKGADTLVYKPRQALPAYNVLIRTDDFRGYKVKSKLWENVEAYGTEKFNLSVDNFLDPAGLSQEDPTAKLGKEYLFDGDTKGETCFGLDLATYKTYLAGPQCLGKPLFVIDFKKEVAIGEVKLYAMLKMRELPLPKDGDYKYASVWQGTKRYADKLPCNVTVYVSNDKDDENSWKEVSHFEQNYRTPAKSQWCATSLGLNQTPKNTLQSPQAVEMASPCYIDLLVPYSSETYRYMKVVANELFYMYVGTGYKGNTDEYVTFHELEIFTKKE